VQKPRSAASGTGGVRGIKAPLTVVQHHCALTVPKNGSHFSAGLFVYQPRYPPPPKLKVIPGPP
jgi:hypothetical protein